VRSCGHHCLLWLSFASVCRIVLELARSPLFPLLSGRISLMTIKSPPSFHLLQRALQQHPKLIRIDFSLFPPPLLSIGRGQSPSVSILFFPEVSPQPSEELVELSLTPSPLFLFFLSFPPFFVEIFHRLLFSFGSSNGELSSPVFPPLLHPSSASGTISYTPCSTGPISEGYCGLMVARSFFPRPVSARTC